MKCAFLGLALGLSAFTATTEAAVVYALTDLGDLPGGENSSVALGINNSGQVVGISSVADGSHAFLYSNGTLADLGLMGDGQPSTIAYDINDLGHIAGHSFGNGGNNRAFLYRDGAMIDLGTLGGAGANAGGVNNSDHVVGVSSDGNGATCGFVWSNGTMTALDGLEGSGTYGHAGGINNQNEIVGISAYFQGPSRAVLWQNGQIFDLGDLAEGLGHATAFAINNSGQVVGCSGLLNPTTSQPFLWENGTMIDLGSLPGRTDWGYARGINNLGGVVGSSGGHGFVWDSMIGMQDLNDLLDSSGAGWELTRAYDINDAGQIAGAGMNPAGYEHGFILTPIPEPSTWAMLVSAAVVILFGPRHRARRGDGEGPGGPCRLLLHRPCREL